MKACERLQVTCSRLATEAENVTPVSARKFLTVRAVMDLVALCHHPRAILAAFLPA